mmetsp:Transcript_48966/g.78899  ORF Transcript_48966/g.78899 Transcript_48966/m.78899 type:complete len:293 (+) Transcript_48966:2390-3268(+)
MQKVLDARECGECRVCPQVVIRPRDDVGCAIFILSFQWQEPQSSLSVLVFQRPQITRQKRVRLFRIYHSRMRLILMIACCSVRACPLILITTVIAIAPSSQLFIQPCHPCSNTLPRIDWRRLRQCKLLVELQHFVSQASGRRGFLLHLEAISVTATVFLCPSIERLSHHRAKTVSTHHKKWAHCLLHTPGALQRRLQHRVLALYNTVQRCHLPPFPDINRRALPHSRFENGDEAIPWQPIGRAHLAEAEGELGTCAVYGNAVAVERAAIDSILGYRCGEAVTVSEFEAELVD